MKPLVITDCDEVLMHFANPFAAYLGGVHDLELKFESFALAGSIKRRACGTALEQHELPPLIDGFFATHMHTQPPVPGAVAALADLARVADIVVLTNIRDVDQIRRTEALLGHGMPYDVICNQGLKGPAVARLAAERANAPVVFIDDLPPHHGSVAKHAPAVHRLHMVADPTLARLIPAAPDAHARIDDWPTALAHIHTIIGQGRTAC